ncbi:DNA-binding protein [Pseudoduganella sp. GCM10020061]|uniref:helix-turn-helix domain-containing transcriptional regulator n=1 Tax=Pseudoduganella sp. GCM10020061 TaxID=3317345 RepID=UPI0036412596
MKAAAPLYAPDSFDEWAQAQFRADRELAVDVLKLSLESLDNPDERGGAMLAIRSLVEAYGGMAVVAKEAGISRVALYRSLSPKGNPTLKTLLAVLRVLKVRLSIVPLEDIGANGSGVANDGASSVESRVA